MPRRSTLALQSAIEDFMAEHGRDPDQRDLIGKLSELQDPVRALAKQPNGTAELSPGRRAAARAANPSSGEKSPIEAARALMGAQSAEGTPA